MGSVSWQPGMPLATKPSFGNSSSGVPVSSTWPSRRSTISSASWMMRSWCEMMTMERPSRASWMSRNVSVRRSKLPQVDAGLRLVVDGQLRVARQDGGDLDALHLAARKALVHLAGEVACRAEAHLGQVLVAGQHGQLLACGDVQKLLHLHALEAGGLLEAVADAQLRALGDGQLGDVVAVEQNLAARGHFDAHDELGKRGLAAPVGPGDDREAVVGNGERQIVDDALGCALAAGGGHLERDVSEFQHGCACLRISLVYLILLYYHFRRTPSRLSALFRFQRHILSLNRTKGDANVDICEQRGMPEGPSGPKPDRPDSDRGLPNGADEPSPGLSTETGEPTHDLLKGTDEPSPGLSQGGQTWIKLLRWRVCVGVRSVIDATFSSIPACFGSAMRPLAMVLMQACGETPVQQCVTMRALGGPASPCCSECRNRGKCSAGAQNWRPTRVFGKPCPQQESHCHPALPQSRRSHGTAASLSGGATSPNPPLPSFSGRFPAIRHLRSKGPSPRNGPSRQSHASFRFSFEVAEAALAHPRSAATVSPTTRP